METVCPAYHPGRTRLARNDGEVPGAGFAREVRTKQRTVEVPDVWPLCRTCLAAPLQGRARLRELNLPRELQGAGTRARRVASDEPPSQRVFVLHRPRLRLWFPASCTATRCRARNLAALDHVVQEGEKGMVPTPVSRTHQASESDLGSGPGSRPGCVTPRNEATRPRRPRSAVHPW